MNAWEAITRRTSVRAFRPDPVSQETVQRLLDAAVRAPNHKLTEPWRFVVVAGDALRRYAEIRRTHRAERFADPSAPEAAAAIAKTYREHLETPRFVFVLQALTDDAVRREEDYASVMMAAQSLMVAAVAEGLGTYLRTGGIMERPEVRALVGATPAQRIVAIVSLGYPSEDSAPRRRTPAAQLTTWLT